MDILNHNSDLDVDVLFDSNEIYEPSASSCCCCCTAATAENSED